MIKLTIFLGTKSEAVNLKRDNAMTKEKGQRD